MDRPKSHQLIKRMIAPLTVWAVTKLLETRAVKERLQEVDAHAYSKKRQAGRALRRAGRNAARRTPRGKRSPVQETTRQRPAPTSSGSGMPALTTSMRPVAGSICA